MEVSAEILIPSARLHETITGQGCIALISGEAGIGKTSVVERFVAQTQERHEPSYLTLWAGCEAITGGNPFFLVEALAYDASGSACECVGRGACKDRRYLPKVSQPIGERAALPIQWCDAAWEEEPQKSCLVALCHAMLHFT